MGNEGSVPEGHGTDDEFEQQARAPPSHSNAPQSTMQSRSGGRMKNALRRDKNKQNNPGDTMGIHTNNGYPMNGDGGSYSTGEDGVMMSQEQQQQYYQQQEMYQAQQQTQMPPNQSHAQHGGQKQQYASTPAPQRNDAPGAQQDVGDMYQSPTKEKKGGLNFRSSGRGAAIINSMKNMSISGAIQKAADKAKSGKGGGEVNEWETKWDEDDDDDSDDGNQGRESHSNKPLHPQVGSTTGSSNAPLATVANFAQPQQKAHLVTATPESDKRPLQRVETTDGAVWDTGLMHGQALQDKPNVQMFLPLLRVLGKGSFGKVRLTVLFH
jgi:hypothetical protein